MHEVKQHGDDSDMSIVERHVQCTVTSLCTVASNDEPCTSIAFCDGHNIDSSQAV